jgi:hypothetical protein
VDAYFEALCGLTWDGMIAVVKSIDPAAARELKAIRAKTQAKHRKQGTRIDLSEHLDNVKMLDEGGNSASYLLRRLANERPDLLEAYERGDFQSVRAAAIAAGIVKPPDAYKQLCRIWAGLSPEDRQRFLEHIAERS